jgi:probable HAF family extracellular repeat protein
VSQGGGAPLDPGSDDLGTANSGSGNSEATSINDFGEIVGASDIVGGSQYHAMFKEVNTLPNEGFADLGVLTGGNRSIALGINNKGTIVGRSRTTTTGNERAFVLFNDGVGMRNLYNMIANKGGWAT